MPAASRHHLVPTGGDPPARTAASSLERPAEVANQQDKRCSRRETDGRPGERNPHRGDLAERLSLFVLATSSNGLSQKPLEPAQYISIRYTERLGEAGIAPSVGSVGDSDDNALAEAVISLFQTEVIRRRGPCRSLEAVGFDTLEWVEWFNARRLLEPIGNIPPVEAEHRYRARNEDPAVAA